MEKVANRKYCIGVDIGGTKINVGIIDTSGNVIAKKKISTEAQEGYEYVINSACDAVEKLLQDNKLTYDDILCTGFGVPGTANSKKGIVEYCPNIHWHNIPLVEIAGKRIKTDICVGQDSQAAALAELLFGAGKGCENIVCITLGTGIGCGIIINRKIYKGSFNTAGELGHTIIDFNGNECACGKRGCLEAHVAGPAILKEGKNRIPSLGPDAATRDIYEHARHGDTTALDIVKNQINITGIALVNIINLLGPDKILISGGMCSEDQLLVKPLISFVEHNIYPTVIGKVVIEKASLGEDSPMIGAAMLYRG